MCQGNLKGKYNRAATTKRPQSRKYEQCELGIPGEQQSRYEQEKLSPILKMSVREGFGRHVPF